MIHQWMLDFFGVTNVSPLDYLPVYMNRDGNFIEILEPDYFAEKFMERYDSLNNTISQHDIDSLTFEHLLVVYSGEGDKVNGFAKYYDFMLSDKYFYYLREVNEFMLDHFLPHTYEFTSNLERVGMDIDYLKQKAIPVDMFDNINIGVDDDILEQVDLALVAFREENDRNSPF
tara:strand:- start:3293 stop:3811 length:519 start_codon:yes stop_codon:yes gene_type:complete